MEKIPTDTFAELIEELRGLGYNIQNAVDLELLNGRYQKSALSVILRYIPLIDDRRKKDALISLVALPGFVEATPILLDEYKKNTDSNILWVIGNTLLIIGDKTIALELIDLLEHKKNIDHPADWPDVPKTPELIAKEMLLWALGKTRDPRALPTLKKYLREGPSETFALEGIKYFDDH